METWSTSSQGAVISTVAWIVVGIAAWLVVAAVVGILIGRMIRRRDRQVPGDSTHSPSAGVPSPTPDQDGTLDEPRVVGRGRRPRA